MQRTRGRKGLGIGQPNQEGNEGDGSADGGVRDAVGQGPVLGGRGWPGSRSHRPVVCRCSGVCIGPAEGARCTLMWLRALLLPLGPPGAPESPAGAQQGRGV